MKRTKYRVVGLVIVMLAIACTAQELNRTTLTSSQVAVYNRLTHQLIAPCCWREPIAVHRSPEAVQMLEEVERLVASGRTEAEIKSFYVGQYGDRILADPEGHTGKWLYAVPIFLFGTLLILAIRRLQALLAVPASASSPFRPDLHERVLRETDIDPADGSGNPSCD